MKVILILIILAAAAGGIAYFLYKKSSHKLSRSGPETNEEEVTLSQLPDENQVLKKIETYFDRLSRDRGQYELYGFYRRQFDLGSMGYDKSYEKKVQLLGSLYSLGLQDFEIECGRTILKKLVRDISHADTTNFTESQCLIFLIEYHEIMGRLKTLGEIEDIVTDRDRFDKYYAKEENQKQELIDSLEI